MLTAINALNKNVCMFLMKMMKWMETWRQTATPFDEAEDQINFAIKKAINHLLEEEDLEEVFLLEKVGMLRILRESSNERVVALCSMYPDTMADGAWKVTKGIKKKLFYRVRRVLMSLVSAIRKGVQDPHLMLPGKLVSFIMVRRRRRRNGMFCWV